MKWGNSAVQWTEVYWNNKGDNKQSNRISIEKDVPSLRAMTGNLNDERGNNCCHLMHDANCCQMFRQPESHTAAHLPKYNKYTILKMFNINKKLNLL